MFGPFRKEKPLQGLIGYGGGAGGLTQSSGTVYGPANYEPITIYAWGGGALGVPGSTPLQPRGGYAEAIIDGTSFPSEYTRLEVWSGGGGSPSGSGSSPNAVFGGGGGGCCPGGAGPDLGSSGGGGTFVFLGNPTMAAVFNPGGTALNIPVADADARCILAAGGMGGKQRASGGVAGGPGGGLVAEGNGGTLSGTAPQVSRGGGGDAYIGQNGQPGGPLGSGGGGGGYEGGHTNTDESGWGGCGYVGHIDPTGAGSRANPYSGTSPVNDVVYTHGVTLGGRNESSTGPLAPTGYNPGSLYANPAKSSQFFPGADTSGNLNGNIGCPLPNGGAGGYAVVSQLSGNATCPGGNLTTYNLTESPGTSYKASGGTIFECGSYTVHRFDVSPTSQTFTTPGSFSETCEYVIIAGGGAGGNDAAGGGGAGQYLTGPTPIGNSASVSITVGSGGSGGAAPSDNEGGDGNDSSAAFPGGTITANGGGGGGKGGSGSQTPGRDGGSGGGGGQRNSKPGGSATPGPGGNDGGTSGPGSGARSGGGGGGAGGAGINGSTNPNDSPTNTVGANGGAGIQLPATFRDPTAPPSRILGCPGPGSPTPLHWVAGGGAGSGDHKGGRGGIGASPTEVNNASEANVNNSGLSGGGDAGSQGGFSYAYPGVPGTGGGGGGANFATPGGNGGDGIVLIAYPT